MRRFIRYDHLGGVIGEISENDIMSLIKREEINGEHSLVITTLQVLNKYERILYEDGRGYWHEYVVAGVDAEHASGKRVVGSYYCVWSLQADLEAVLVSVMPGTQGGTTAGLALQAALSTQSRWTVGTVTNMTTGGASMYDMTAWKALAVLVQNWGGELSTTISVSSTGVVSRAVDYYDMQGNQTALRRFDFGSDLMSIKRTFPDTPFFCRISPRGKGAQTDGGGYGRKIRINDDDPTQPDWIEYAPMVDVAKLPNGSSGYIYPTLIVENSDCETPADLLAWGNSVLAGYCTPKVTYEMDVIQAGAEGVDVSGVSLGDAVDVVDRYFNGGLRVSGRVIAQTVDELNERDVSLTIGQATDTLAAKFANAEAAYAAATNMQQYLATAAYIDELLGRINAEINATGGYVYITQGQGLRTYDTAVSDPLVGAEASQVVEIKGGNIRIANTKTAQGEWEWRTVIQSGLLVADIVYAAAITSGYIGNVAGDNYWNLDSNEMRITGELTLKSRHTIAEGSTTYVKAITKNGVVTVAEFNDYYRLTGSTASSTNYCQGLLVGLYNDAETTEYSEILLLPSRYTSSSYWSAIACNRPLHVIGLYNGTTSSWLSLGTNAVMSSNTRGSGGYDSTNASIAAKSDGTAQVSGSPVKLYVGSSSEVDVQFSNNTYNKYKFTSSALIIGYSTSLTANLQVYGNLSVSGTKPRLVDTPHYSERLLYAYETPSPMFGDIGSGTIGDDGFCYVEIDDIFSETARADLSYQVFLQKCGQGDLWVESKSPTHFVVAGTPGLKFDWEMKCRQRDYEALRMEQPDLDPADMHGIEIDENVYGYIDYVTEIEQAYAA